MIERASAADESRLNAAVLAAIAANTYPAELETHSTGLLGGTTQLSPAKDYDLGMHSISSDKRLIDPVVIKLFNRRWWEWKNERERKRERERERERAALRKSFQKRIHRSSSKKNVSFPARSAGKQRTH